jgi:hypothetical protein
MLRHTAGRRDRRPRGGLNSASRPNDRLGYPVVTMRVPVTAEAGRVTEENKKLLGDYLATGALYVPFEIPGIWLEQDNVENILPAEIQRSCESDRCKGDFEPTWQLARLPQNILPGTCAGLLYNCRNCGAAFHVWFWWEHTYSEGARAAIAGARMVDGILTAAGGVPLRERVEGTFHFKKVGQFPPPLVKVPRDLADALGDHAELYRRALICRNQGYGIGAFAYFRRVVEETMDEMLTLLGASLKEDGADAAVVARVETAKGARAFERKAEIAADALPESFRRGGFNPFGALHTLYSDGVHAQTDAECVEIVDQMREEMDIIFKTLKTHVADRKGYKDAAVKFQSKAASRRLKQ